ncbi:MAG: YerC/YecD family TrpR-related protein [Clostridia bacterium]|nr:YerC/YecD family TrpR-related protein [Clostridia bacterium]
MNIHSESVDRLFRTILQLETVEDCYRYFEDLCTIKEIQDMAQRLDAAVLLSEGVSYQKIAEQVNISSATICRVNKCLNYGEGGYRVAIEKLKAEKEEEKK